MAANTKRSSIGMGALSAILGIVLIIISALLLSQSLGYPSDLGHVFGNPIPNLGKTSVNVEVISRDYNNRYNSRNVYMFHFMGYDVDPFIWISSGGIIVGFLQLASCFLLCSQRSNLSRAWVVVQLVILIGLIICIAIAIYWEVYSSNSIPGVGGSGIVSSPYNGNAPGLGYQNSHYNNPGPQYGHGIGYSNSYSHDPRYGINTFDYSNPTGQAFLGILGIDIIFVVVGAFVVGCTNSRSDEDTISEDDVYKGREMNHRHG